MLEYFSNLVFKTIFNNILTILLFAALLFCLIFCRKIRKVILFTMILPMLLFSAYVLHKMGLIEMGEIMHSIVKWYGYLAIDCLTNISIFTSHIMGLLPFGNAHLDCTNVVMIASLGCLFICSLMHILICVPDLVLFITLIFAYCKEKSLKLKEKLTINFNAIKEVYLKKTLILKLTTRMNN